METLPIIALASLITGALCAAIITIDICLGNRQRMKIMNVVYLLTALYAGPLALWVYYTIGRQSAQHKGSHPHNNSHDQMQMKGNMHPNKPFWQSVAIGALHCGSGCTLGDILAECLLIAMPVTLFGSTLYGAWAVDFVFAFVIGIVFQYYAIKPMRKLSTGEALKAAVKADTLSLIFWQIGMYGWMAIATFIIFRHRLAANAALFWLMMQIGMLLGFVTAYPINWWLIKKGIKEAM